MVERQSINFEFIRAHKAELAEIGALAESYAYSDPVSSLVKLRLFAEVLVSGLYAHWQLPKPYQANLNDLLNESCFNQSVPSVIVNKIHLLRKAGNGAAHSNRGATPDALRGLQIAFDLARWLYVSLYKGTASACGEYKAPHQIDLTAKAEAEKKKLMVMMSFLWAKTKVVFWK